MFPFPVRSSGLCRSKKIVFFCEENIHVGSPNISVRIDSVSVKKKLFLRNSRIFPIDLKKMTVLTSSALSSLKIHLCCQEELHRRDAILSGIQASVITLVNQRLAESLEKTRARESELSPARLKREPPSPMTPDASQNSKGRDAFKTQNPLSHLNAQQTSHASPGRPSSRGRNRTLRPNSSGSRSCPAIQSRRPLGSTSGRLAAGEQPPSPPSRSQPLRALTGGAVSTHEPHDDRNGPDTPFTGRKIYFSKARDNYAPSQRAFSEDHAVATLVDVADRAAFPQPLPRVADVEGVQRSTLARQKVKAAEAAALVKPPPRGRTALYYPSWYDPAQADTSLPNSKLALEYVHGYAGEIPSGSIGGSRNSATRNTNVLWLRTGEVVFPASALVVIHNFEVNRQRFFRGHDEVKDTFLNA